MQAFDKSKGFCQLIGSRASKRILIVFITLGILLYIFSPKSIPSKITQNQSNLTENTTKRKQYENSMQPSTEYEQLRRKIRRSTLEMYNFVSAELDEIEKKAKKNVTELGQYINIIKSKFAEHRRSLVNDIDRSRMIDGYEKWRRSELEKLSNLVQRRLKYVQNPPDCSKARKIVCRVDKACGIGCQIHHLAFCLIMSYATERTLIVQSKGWNYYNGEWGDIFQPVSETCTSIDGSTSSKWDDRTQKDNRSSQVLHLAFHEWMNTRPAQYPLVIPEDLAPQLTRLHSEPIVWWVGQMMKYLFRFQPKTQAFIDAGIKTLGFKKPIVGVHVRRTDKVQYHEADLHTVDEYMKWVDDYYEQLEMIHQRPVDKRRVFIAADDPKVIAEARKNYPNHEIIADPKTAERAMSNRFSNTSLYELILDIHLLSISDHLVCTFSSTVCRAVYTIRLGLDTNVSNANDNIEPHDRFNSLDDIYSFAGQDNHIFKAVLPHRPTNQSEMSINIGDTIDVPECWRYHCQRYKNGYLEGKNLRTNQTGAFPTFKIIDQVKTAKFPIYPHLSLDSD